MKINVILNQTSIQKHTSLIVTGLLQLKEKNIINLTINNLIEEDNGFYDKNIGITEVIINDYKVIFDMADGYSDVVEIKRKIMDSVDFYFRRSYSKEWNEKLFNKNKHKIYPLGLNYYVSHPDNLFLFDNRSVKQKLIRTIGGIKPDSWFTTDVFESEANYKEKNLKILFFCRLWEPNENDTQEEIEQKQYINNMRIDIIRKLKKTYQKNFMGGDI